MLLDRRRGRVRQHRAIEPALAVDVRGRGELAHERAIGAARDGHVRAAGQLEHAERVVGRLVEGLVAMDGRHPEQLDLGARKRQQEGDRVVVPRVAVDDDRVLMRPPSRGSVARGKRGPDPSGRTTRHAASMASISPTVGSDG